MAEPTETAASLRISGADLDPEVVTAILGKHPSATALKGDVLCAGQKRERIAQLGFWRLKASRRSPGDIDAHVKDLLDGTTDDVAAWLSVTSKYHTDLFCGLFLKEEMAGLSISPNTLQTLGERGISLELDIYSERGDE